MKRACAPLLITLVSSPINFTALIGIVVAGIPYFVKMAEIIGSGREVDTNQMMHAAVTSLSPLASWLHVSA